ncbi:MULTISPECIES: hypothetical protein [unclassified Neorhizobium]|uniref:hypothetical protein n=1 Tax=unclassified Neorhizobium TaxID=2629175 RepID=UPI001FF33904|nr:MULTISPECIES: hypothetical protein [unclassified Neorhizobium]MCJ9673575.1 hypothetical protein [Neorhizobium sp. SHOUNA12B]MCJ9748784.1 hypothetical protein [Neorhizobium sp. SHOUNA12A]
MIEVSQFLIYANADIFGLILFHFFNIKVTGAFVICSIWNALNRQKSPLGALPHKR